MPVTAIASALSDHCQTRSSAAFRSPPRATPHQPEVVAGEGDLFVEVPLVALQGDVDNDSRRERRGIRSDPLSAKLGSLDQWEESASSSSAAFDADRRRGAAMMLDVHVVR
jgi:hypothetical protein